MTKQKYDSKKYSPAAWLPLAKWVRDAPEAQKDLRHQTLVRFTKEDTEFWDIVAKCLRSMSTAANLPWGRSAMESSVYLAVPSYEKVTVKYALGSIFFYVRSLKSYMDGPSLDMRYILSIYDTGLGDSLWDSKYS